MECISELEKLLNHKIWKFVNSNTKMRPSIPELYISAKYDVNEITSDNQIKAETLLLYHIGSISPITKNKGNKNSTENYRPVSLSIACNILESIIRESLLDYLKTNNILSSRQFGFLCGRSTILQLLKVRQWIEILVRRGKINNLL